MKPTATDEPDRNIPAGTAHRTRIQHETVPVEVGDILYRYVAELEVAQVISQGIHRFYDLTKYMKIEDEHGRSDSAEGAVTFPEEEYISNPEKLPVASYNGIEFHCISMRVNEEYLSQYFVLCMSTEASESVLSDSKYRVEIHRDEFETLSLFMNPSVSSHDDNHGLKFFSHGPVEYYDIDNHPAPIPNERWKEVYVKHRRFMHQHEYRAAFFINDSAVERISNQSEVIRRIIYLRDGRNTELELKFHFRAGRDDDGWRYIEIDTSDFRANLNLKPARITELE